MVIGLGYQLGGIVFIQVQCSLQRLEATEDDGILDGQEASGAKTRYMPLITRQLLSPGLFEAVTHADI